ncbi:hypothetical protein DICPUDRAFT_95548 [Dictyostelium purpureum]|uniref:Uncharacterized protein n=1 Tax=Dictyostelium purpureum TaxID=5786 RepID=F0ZXQ9_DICPU|nr:uncharacterized protein DICPUDRAFT_95548 [Dictyostelium purpureum]EGC31268.1 hypothetical protein DICPUDRAFT_95548 [Dictyostelium purpureum]|eukprot:XP_003292213.1 hypothetical protein DICPUDRAFT_95548 [Dictyostelium purpureum]
MTDRPYHYFWINRAHNPHPREFIGGYHTGAVCEHNHKGKLVPMKKHMLLKDYRGTKDPREYRNTLYDNPSLHLLGYHERKYLLKGREYFVPTYYEKPYYIDQITIHDTITRSDLTRRNIMNAHVLAHRLDDRGKYSYRDEPLYADKMKKEAIKVSVNQKKNDYMAKKSAIEKEGELRAIDRNASLKTKPVNGPILREEPIETTTYIETIYETVPTKEEVIVAQPIPSQQTTTTTTTTAPIYKQEEILVPVIEETAPAPTNVSYTEVTNAPVMMTSSEFGGSSSGKKGKKQKFKKETIIQKSNDGGKSWTNDSKLASDKVEFIEETTTTTTTNNN